MLDKFDYKDKGEVKEYVNCIIGHNQAKRSLNMTQLALMQSFEDEFEIPEGYQFIILAASGSFLMSVTPITS